ncbi:PTS glucitol/sorbitol transporter subunit IIA [Acerihabitans sp. TG2]|uniref:PTS glucitol/sorbitol transporter subunit IIA n=1 Tax=Acerihabitans sp. TG2 TaxID=3096008 RepID=UPI002B23241D|nr:PTS glucitol/sorbitol transporter subunit IIA [Acerihabitans sp. TG2]MEA9391605.1 PTS glucitol/sorbitol transporter subunit IIA [Acerihabitans sp. TG2]
MNPIFHTTFTRIGEHAAESLADNMVITFREGAPEDLESYCFIHSHSETHGELRVGGKVIIGEDTYAITAVGAVATENLRELGHLTLRFDGAVQAEFPGSMHLAGRIPTDISIGSDFSIFA